MDCVHEFQFYKPSNNFSFIIKNNIFEKFKDYFYELKKMNKFSKI